MKNDLAIFEGHELVTDCHQLKMPAADGELNETATIKNYLQVRAEGGREVARRL